MKRPAKKNQVRIDKSLLLSAAADIFKDIADGEITANDFAEVAFDSHEEATILYNDRNEIVTSYPY